MPREQLTKMQTWVLRQMAEAPKREYVFTGHHARKYGTSIWEARAGNYKVIRAYSSPQYFLVRRKLLKQVKSGRYQITAKGLRAINAT